MPANRVAALVAVLTQLGVIAAGIAGAFPGKYGDAIAVGAALLSKAAVVVTFLKGSQKYDALIARGVRAAQLSAAPATTGLFIDVDGHPVTAAGDDEPGDAFDALPHHAVTDHADIPLDKGDAGTAEGRPS